MKALVGAFNHLFVDGVVCGEVGGLGHVATLGLAAPAPASSQQVEDGDCEAELGQDTHLGAGGRSLVITLQC